MDMIYIAINGDNVGEGIGNAIASDNHEQLEKITGGLKGAHNSIKEWVESVGGKVITESGDEGIYQIPNEAYSEDQLDDIREMYSKQTGTTVTLGVGESMSEASKALIYGKLNDKDQIVEYDSHIDDYIASHHEDEDEVEEELPEESDLQDDLEDEMEEEQGMVDDEEFDGIPSNISNNNLEDGGQEDSIPEMEESAIRGESASEETDETQDDQGIDDEVEEDFDSEDIDEDIDEDDDTVEMDADEFEDEHERLIDTLRSPDHEDDLEEADEQEAELQDMRREDGGISPEDKIQDVVENEDEDDTTEIEVPEDEVDGDYGSEEMAEAQPDHELEMDEDEEFIHDAQENRQDELDDDIIEADEEGDVSEDEQHNMISDMIHANMEDDSQENNDELKQKIMQSLQSFKQNKGMIEQAKQADPQFYSSIMNMLQSMIEMAKQLNISPEQEIEKSEKLNKTSKFDSKLSLKGKQARRNFGSPMSNKLVEEKGVARPSQVGSKERDKKNKLVSGTSQEGRDARSGNESYRGKKGISRLASKITNNSTSKDNMKYAKDQSKKRKEWNKENKPDLPKSEQEIEKFENWREYHKKKDAEKKAKDASRKKTINGKKSLDHALEEVQAQMSADKKNKKGKTAKKK